MINIIVPQMGESITEATVGKWACKDGDFVEHDQVLVEIETDKAATEIPAPKAGILSIKEATGKDVPIGAVLGTIKPATATPQFISQKSPKDNFPIPPLKRGEEQKSLAPSAQRISKQRELSQIDLPKGTGRGGVILKQDFPNHATERPSLDISHHQDQQKIVPMTRLRRTIAARLKHAQNQAVMLSTFNDVDMSKLLNLRNSYRDIFKDKHDVRLGFLSFFVKASISALKEFPIVNAFVDGDNILYNYHYHIAVAVSTDKGLFTPVVRDGEQLSLAHIEREISAFAKQAQEGRLSHEDMQGGTFTISNGGVYGSLLSTPVLNPPQSAILGIHRVEERAVVRDGKVVVAPMMYLALAYDHRIIDGREAVSFLVRVKQSLEDPQRLLLDV